MPLSPLQYAYLSGAPRPHVAHLRRTPRLPVKGVRPADHKAPFSATISAKLEIPLDPGFDTWDRITPDPTGEDPIYLASALFTLPSRLEIEKCELRAAWHYQHAMARLYGIYSAKGQRAAAVFAAMFAARSFAIGGAL